MSSAPQSAPLLAFLPRPLSAVVYKGAKADLGLSWYLWIWAVFVPFALLGESWGGSWHHSFGGDGFWTPAHMAIYLCGVLAGVAGLCLLSQARLSYGRAVALCVAILLLCSPRMAQAHIGSKDVFEEISSGPYKLFVTIRPPTVVPGMAAVEVRILGPQVNSIRAAPVPLVGEAAQHPPVANLLKRSGADASFYSGSVWLMASGSWKIRFEVEGAGGEAKASVPMPSVALSVLPMRHPVGLVLAGLGLVLALGMTGILFAAVRQARPSAGELPATGRTQRVMVAGGVAFAMVIVTAWFGNRWWRVEAADYRDAVFHSLTMQPVLHGATLDLYVGAGQLEAKGQRRSNTDFLLDHGKVMHLYALRWPEMDAVYHLHPSQMVGGDLRLMLPAMVPGTYHLFGDIVHRNGFPETLTAILPVPPDASRAPLDAEDAAATPAPLSRGDLGNRYVLPDGYTMVWDRPGTLTASTAELFRFKLYDAKGELATDVEPYLGMAGHAAFVKTDGSVFAHTHPDGSAAMPAMMLANGGMSDMAATPMDGTDGENAPQKKGENSAEPLDPIVEFPYGFPTGGRYRIFVQMRHGNVVETGVFDAEVKPAV